jgi:hypothetical protein
MRTRKVCVYLMTNTIVFVHAEGRGLALPGRLVTSNEPQCGHHFCIASMWPAVSGGLAFAWVVVPAAVSYVVAITGFCCVAHT